MNPNQSPLWRQVTWTQICAGWNHCKKSRAQSDDAAEACSKPRHCDCSKKNSYILFFNLCVQYILRLITGWNYIRLSYSSHCKPISFQNTTQNCFVKILAPAVKMGLRRPCNLKSDAPSANLGCKIRFSPNAVCPRALSSVACETSTSEADSSVKINPAVPWK